MGGEERRGKEREKDRGGNRDSGVQISSEQMNRNETIH